jgi:hypothetical protein
VACHVVPPTPLPCPGMGGTRWETAIIKDSMPQYHWWLMTNRKQIVGY